jgi:hypothetical protein
MQHARPIYETQTQLKNEQGIAKHVADQWGGVMVKLPKMYPIDYIFTQDSICLAWVEIKSREVPRDKYLTYFFNVDKAMFGKQLAHETGLPFLLVVSWAGDIAFLNFKKAYPIKFCGRQDRGDWQDQSPAYEIPIDEFESLT